MLRGAIDWGGRAGGGGLASARPPLAPPLGVYAYAAEHPKKLTHVHLRGTNRESMESQFGAKWSEMASQKIVGIVPRN
jgi:hypothetical protein